MKKPEFRDKVPARVTDLKEILENLARLLRTYHDNDPDKRMTVTGAHDKYSVSFLSPPKTEGGTRHTDFTRTRYNLP
jgi:hypothetical protein